MTPRKPKNHPLLKTDTTRIPSDQAARDRITQNTSTNLVVDAGAGTGKTSVLMDRLLHLLLEEGVELERVVAITFTDKAAAELTARLRKKLEEKISDGSYPKRNKTLALLHQLERANISTIHSFCAQILREYPVEAGLDPRFQVFDRTQADVFEDEYWQAWLARALDTDASAFLGAKRLGMTLKTITDLKDSMMKHQAGLQKPQPEDFPNPEETWARMNDLFSEISKKNCFCLKPDDAFLKKFHEAVEEWRLLKNKKGLSLAFALAQNALRSQNGLGNQKNWKGVALEEVREKWGNAREALDVFKAKLGHAIFRNLEVWLADYARDYDDFKRLKGVLDYDDLLLKTLELLKENESVRGSIKRRFDRLFVDEFQDTDPIQVEIVFFLCEAKGTFEKDWRKVKPAPAKLFLVGDPKQSIYRFRKADIQTYLEAKEKVTGDKGGSRESLIENFRTVKPLVDCTNQCFAPVFSGGITYEPLSPYRPQAPEDKGLPPLVVLPLPPQAREEGSDKDFEAETVAVFVRDLLEQKPEIYDKDLKKHRPLVGRDIAILFRFLTTYEEAYEEAFRKVGIPFQVVGGKRFYTRPEVAALATLLECLDAPGEEALTKTAITSSSGRNSSRISTDSTISVSRLVTPRYP